MIEHYVPTTKDRQRVAMERCDELIEPFGYAGAVLFAIFVVYHMLDESIGLIILGVFVGLINGSISGLAVFIIVRGLVWMWVTRYEYASAIVRMWRSRKNDALKGVIMLMGGALLVVLALMLMKVAAPFLIYLYWAGAGIFLTWVFLMVIYEETRDAIRKTGALTGVVMTIAKMVWAILASLTVVMMFILLMFPWAMFLLWVMLGLPTKSAIKYLMQKIRPK